MHRVLQGALVLALVFIGCEARATNLMVAVSAGPQGDAVKLLSQSYTAAHVDVVELPYDTLREQLRAQLARAHPAFDIVLSDDPWFPELAKYFADIQGIPASLLDDIVPQCRLLGMAPDGNGAFRGLPFVGNSEVLFVNKDILGKFGIQNAPRDWSALAEVAERITRDSKAVLGSQVYGYAIRGRAGAPIVTDFLPLFWSFGGRLLSHDGTSPSVIANKATLIRALEIYDRLSKASPPGAINYDWKEMTDAFAGGRVAMEINWPIGIPPIEAAVAQHGSISSAGWQIDLPPATTDYPNSSMLGNWLLAIPRNSSNGAAAQAFIIWALENQGQGSRYGKPSD